jgi:aminoglycoside phosphotransferase (APT) family kinase protein
MYPNLPDHEAAALGHLAGTGLAPELVSFTPAHDHQGALLVYRYVVGPQWRRGVGDVARLLHAVHAGPAPRGLRTLHRSAVEALARADEVIADVPVADERRRVLDQRPTAGVGDRPVARPSLVHTDCGPGNLVRSRRGLVLIDWQCPGLGDPVEDLACFLSPAMMVLYAAPPHGRSAIESFLAAYPDREVVDRYRRDGVAWHYRIAAYCLWRAHRLAEAQPEVADRYRVALTAELALLASQRH